ncbi:MAG: tRNA 4-thiouridine(8) synthase ThiI [Bacilli bacterium]|nr:tRNA 4-thiouridine(8) synthase ThiI [Bacilli bacterium]
MKKVIIIKYAELNTKKDNIDFFIKILRKNIQNTLNDDTKKITYDHGRMFIESTEDDFEDLLKKVKKVFGIHEINIAYKLDTTDFDTIKDTLADLVKDADFNTFKVATKRSDKSYPLDSMEISKKLGGVVLRTLNDKGVTVDVHNPEVTINVEVRRGQSYIYFERVKGLGGYPVGSLGKGLLMLSGGIDSPVAGYLALKRGVRIEAIYFESPPHTSEDAKNKVLKLAKKLSEYSGYVKIHVINFTEIQETILKNAPHDYLITLMRRMMYRITERVAYKNNCKCIVNGESIGQVASQTLTSMSCINAVTNMPVIRPVACLDKNDIIDIAKDIDTYKISIEPFEDCCTIFVPKHPVINPDVRSCEEYEANVDYDALVKKAVETSTVIKVENNSNTQIKEDFKDLF